MSDRAPDATRSPVPSLAIACLGTMLLAGCGAGSPPRVFAPPEHLLATGDETTLHSHAASYYPYGVSLAFPGFVVAIDKSPRTAVLGDTPLHLRDVSRAGAGVSRDAQRLADDSKLLYVSHVHEYSGKPYGAGNCFHYSVYQQPGDAEPLVPPCPEATPPSAQSPFASSFDAMRHLREVLSARLHVPPADRPGGAGGGSDYTHLIVMVMGWNTPQVESFRNFNSLMGHLHEASGGDRAFRPLFIGVTWPSFWANDWLDPLWKLFSYPNKANDADELGLSWLGVLLHEVVGRLPSRGLSTMVVGHSFGARAASMATCVGSAIEETPGTARRLAPLDLFVGLQPAFSINRFLPDSESGALNEHILYPDDCAPARRLVLTASAHDEAVDSQFVADMAADEESWARLCESRRRSPFECLRLDEAGQLSEQQRVPEARLIYLEASSLFRYNAHGTGGGAHSDIYRADTGRLLWRLLETLP